MIEVAEVGKSMKVRLPGESPWADCIAVNHDGTWIGRITNYLVSQGDEEERRKVAEHLFGDGTPPLPVLHHYRSGDLLRFKKDDEFEIWVPDESFAGTA